MNHEPANEAAFPGASAGFVPRLATFPTQAPVVPGHELLVSIGGGSYGQVWLARNVMGTLRAIKVVWRSTFEQAGHFEREYKGLQKFEPISRSHEGLVDILQVGRDDAAGYFYYVMELADDAGENPNDECRKPKEALNPNAETPASREPIRNSSFGLPSSFDIRHWDFYIPRTLRTDFQRRGPLPPDECVALGLKLSSALEHLHQNGLVHRDIKPSNIIFVKGEPKLADIGLVTAIGEAQSLVGTVGYIPPEGPGTAQADLYSLGKLLYEAALGKDRQDFPQLPPDFPSHPDYGALLEINEVILKACESDPRRRYPTARQMQADLALLQHGKSVKQARTRERHWAVAKKFALGGALVALLIAVFPFLKSRTGHRPTPAVTRLYELGKFHYNQLTPDDHKKASNYLAQAIEADPKFVQPYGEFVGLYAWDMFGVPTDQARLQKLKEIADKLGGIAPTSAEHYMALSWCGFLERDWRRAEEQITKAIKANPDLAIAREFHSFYLGVLERYEEAHREARRAEELEPAARVTAVVAAWPFMKERRFDLALAQLQRLMEQDRNFAEGHYWMGFCYEAQSNYVAAINEFEAADSLYGTHLANVKAAYDALRQAYNTQGAQGYWRKWIDLNREDGSDADRGTPVSDHDLAGCYAMLGEKEKALDDLEKHFDEPMRWHSIRYWPPYDNLHGEPRFNALVKRAGFEK
jgi:hypothetical protein